MEVQIILKEMKIQKYNQSMWNLFLLQILKLKYL